MKRLWIVARRSLLGNFKRRTFKLVQFDKVEQLVVMSNFLLNGLVSIDPELTFALLLTESPHAQLVMVAAFFQSQGLSKALLLSFLSS